MQLPPAPPLFFHFLCRVEKRLTRQFHTLESQVRILALQPLQHPRSSGAEQLSSKQPVAGASPAGEAILVPLRAGSSTRRAPVLQTGGCGCNSRPVHPFPPPPWRNSKRAGPRSRCPSGRAGATPVGGTPLPGMVNRTSAPGRSRKPNAGPKPVGCKSSAILPLSPPPKHWQRCTAFVTRRGRCKPGRRIHLPRPRSSAARMPGFEPGGRGCNSCRGRHFPSGDGVISGIPDRDSGGYGCKSLSPDLLPMGP